MKTFDDFLSENDTASVVTSTRKSMRHFEDMKPQEFILWAKEILSNFKGKLVNPSVTLKVDGVGGRFGKDANGKFFFEGSRTGPIFVPGSFSAHARQKSPDNIEILQRSQHYDDIFTSLRDASLMKRIPNNTKVFVEIFYNPMATHDVDGLTFVTVKYDKNKLGQLMTLVPYKIAYADSEEERHDSKQIMDSLLESSNLVVKVVSAKLRSGDIDISASLNIINTITSSQFDKLASRKSADQEEKQLVSSIVNRCKEEVAAAIIASPSIIGKDLIGEDMEGLIIEVGGNLFKITTPSFKQRFKEKNAKRT